VTTISERATSPKASGLDPLSKTRNETTYKYDDAGERVIKRTSQGETAYINRFWRHATGATAPSTALAPTPSSTSTTVTLLQQAYTDLGRSDLFGQSNT
jgi:YD repeat-containing protein